LERHCSTVGPEFDTEPQQLVDEPMVRVELLMVRRTAPIVIADAVAPKKTADIC
jgi:hypothetical protein